MKSEEKTIIVMEKKKNSNPSGCIILFTYSSNLPYYFCDPALAERIHIFSTIYQILKWMWALAGAIAELKLGRQLEQSKWTGFQHVKRIQVLHGYILNSLFQLDSLLSTVCLMDSVRNHQFHTITALKNFKIPPSKLHTEHRASIHSYSRMPINKL